MKIYVSHSSLVDYKNDLYEPIRKSELFKEHSFIFPHEDSKEPFRTKELFESGKCGLVIADVSFPSTGQGIELAWADACGIPIICFVKSGNKFSLSLNLITNDFFPYEAPSDIIEVLKNKLS
jgi:hypothetical protein